MYPFLVLHVLSKTVKSDVFNFSGFEQLSVVH